MSKARPRLVSSFFCKRRIQERFTHLFVVLRLYAENDRLRIRKFVDCRKIQKLLGLCFLGFRFNYRVDSHRTAVCRADTACRAGSTRLSLVWRPTRRAALTQERTRGQKCTTTAVYPGAAHHVTPDSSEGIKQLSEPLLTAEALQAQLEDQIPFAKQKVCLLDEYLRACSFVRLV